MRTNPLRTRNSFLSGIESNKFISGENSLLEKIKTKKQPKNNNDPPFVKEAYK